MLPIGRIKFHQQGNVVKSGRKMEKEILQQQKPERNAEA